MDNKLPIYQITIDENNLEQGVGFISLVENPAIEIDWIKLNEQKPMTFKLDADKRLLVGAFLVPDKLIYRNTEEMGEFYIKFSSNEIEKIIKKFNKDGNNKNLNFEHSNKKVNGYVVENWLTSNPDKSQKYGFDLPEGTWFGSVFIEDEEFWNNVVKTGDVKGFSVEVFAKMMKSELTKNNKIEMNEKLKLNTKEGVELIYDILEVGAEVFVEVEGNLEPANGTFTLEDGKIIVIEAGKIVTIEEVKEEEEQLEEEVVVEEPKTEVSMDAVTQLVNDIVNPLMDSIRLFEERIAALENKLVEEQKTNEELSAQVELLSKTPKVESPTKKTDSPTFSAKLSVEDKVKKLQNLVRK
jgi:Mg2+ and Co2+ transporter CorA